MATVRQLLGNVKGDTGDTGVPNEVVGEKHYWCLSDDGNNRPIDSQWSETMPDLGTSAQGKYLWSKTEIQYAYGASANTYEVTFIGRDGSWAGEDRMTKIENDVADINDYTTGINLLRGTRDFRVGVNAISESSVFHICG